MGARRDYAVVTASYWSFTLTDGALRMLVLFHLHQLGYTPLEVVSLFLFYELFGIVTNFVGGWLGARFGLRLTLFAGLGCQIVACGALAAFAHQLSVPLVMAAQGLSGVAKDLTKMSSKSYIKLVVRDGDASGLMKWVAILTGSKNALKGIGFFLGGVLLQGVGFQNANLGMAAALLVALLAAVALLPPAMGKAKARVRWQHLLVRDARVQWLSAARLFLFGSRDVWFVFALPVFLSAELGWSHAQAGGFLAAWVIGYGIVQASAPSFVARSAAPDARRVGWWTALLLLPLGALAIALQNGFAPAASLMVGLAVFGVVFAANSAIHSFLIVHYADRDSVSLNVGFYYMANAAGRLAGTVLSGAVYQWAGGGRQGLVACLVASMILVGLSLLCSAPLRSAERRALASASAA